LQEQQDVRFQDRQTQPWQSLAGITGAGLLPPAANAATVTALAVTCIDYRLVDDAVKLSRASI
jgi:hypothetical protein